MERLKDDFIDIVDDALNLKNKHILEIGCGSGTRTKSLASRCQFITAIEPNSSLLELARDKNSLSNIEYYVGSAEKLEFKDKIFDTVIFTLSFHHVLHTSMDTAIREATRVLKDDGKIVFLEPTNFGTFFDFEIIFDACDGDERKSKAYAYYKMLDSSLIVEVAEIYDETILKFDSEKDFIETLKPKKNLTSLNKELLKNKYTLNAKRRINIFKKV